MLSQAAAIYICRKCQKITSPNAECRFYGECCGDPVRIRERLEPGTFSCLSLSDDHTGILLISD